MAAHHRDGHCGVRLYTTLFTSCNAVFATSPAFILNEQVARNLPDWSVNRIPTALLVRSGQIWRRPALIRDVLQKAGF
jgi:hypothetical protein